MFFSRKSFKYYCTGEISHVNALPGVSGRGAAHMCESEEAGVSQRLPGRLPGYLLVQGLRLSPPLLDCEA